MSGVTTEVAPSSVTEDKLTQPPPALHSACLRGPEYRGVESRSFWVRKIPLGIASLCGVPGLRQADVVLLNPGQGPACVLLTPDNVSPPAERVAMSKHRAAGRIPGFLRSHKQIQ